MSKKILFLTSANLSTNPRLVKEIDFLSIDHSITVILFKLGNWSDKMDLKMREDRPSILFIELDVTRERFFYWLFWSLIQKVSQIIWPLFKKSLFISAIANTRRSIMLLEKCKSFPKPDLIISHNLGALYPAYGLSKKWNIPFIFDVEDYHPGEQINIDTSNEISRREILMKTILQHATALTSASPLIGEITLKLIGGHHNHRVIINSFLQNEFKIPKYDNSEFLKFVWFSQNVSFGRGLEQFFEALQIVIQKEENVKKLRTNNVKRIVFTIIGNLDASFNSRVLESFLKSVVSSTSLIELVSISPLTQKELHVELGNHDIGLALEFNSTDLNRNICLTNKIISYSQAGLYILATNTAAQFEFINDNPLRGVICGQSSTEIADVLTDFNLDDIRRGKVNRFENGKLLAWEEEGIKIKSLIENIL